VLYGIIVFKQTLKRGNAKGERTILWMSFFRWWGKKSHSHARAVKKCWWVVLLMILMTC